MPNYIVQGSDLSSVAGAIRTKGSTSAQLAFPTGFVSAIEALPSGGGGKEIVLIASGTYTKTDYASVNSRVDIPVSFSGTPVQCFVTATPVADQSQTYQWASQFEVTEEIATNFGYTLGRAATITALGVHSAANATAELISNNTIIRCGQASSSYHVLDNTYTWYIWGYNE